MSSIARIRGFTGWANFRLQPKTKLMTNILSEIMTGSYFKTLVESMTGLQNKKITEMDDLSPPQREMRIQWIVEELKTQRVIAKEAEFDSKYCAIPSPDHIFELIWRLVTYDIIFIWERYDFLMLEQDEILIKYRLNWVPEVPAQAPKKLRKKVNFMAGFGGAAEKFEVVEPASVEPVDPFPSSSEMKAFKTNRPKITPSPKDCIFEIVNAILKVVGSTQEEITVCNIEAAPNFYVLFFHQELIQIADVRVMVPLINYFFGNVFTADVLLNDRWSMNLILRAAERLIRLEGTSMKTEDLVECDKMASCAYLCALFMLGFQYRQATAVLRVESFYKDQMKAMQRQLNDLKAAGDSVEYFKKHGEFEKVSEGIKKELDRLAKVFDIAMFKTWKKHVDKVKSEIYGEIVEAMKRKFEIILFPKTMTLNTFCISHMINLFLTNGVAFVLTESRQVVPRSTKLVIRKKASGSFYENFSGNEESERKLHKLLSVKPKDEEITIAPDTYSDRMEVYVEFSGGNRRLTEGASFLYQIFPSDFNMYIQQLISAARSGRQASVRTLLTFFSPTWPDFVDERDAKTGETALHAAASAGLHDMVLLLLENFAKINVVNKRLETPLHNAMENFHRLSAQMLAEWGCDLNIGNLKGESAMAICKNGTLVNHITDWSNYCRISSERIARNHDAGYLMSVIKMHNLGQKAFVSLRSRVVAGSTLLHAAAYLGSLDAVKELLDSGVDPNVTDYKGATPLHCTTDFAIAKTLLLAGADINATDREGNTALHLRAFGGIVIEAKNKHRYKKDILRLSGPESVDTGKVSVEPLTDRDMQLQNGLENSRQELLDPKLLYLLLDFSADFVQRNKKGLLPIHCAAIRGRNDIMEFLLQHNVDPDNLQKNALLEDGVNAPSLTYLSLAYGHIDCARWLTYKAGFKLKHGEADELLQTLLTQKMKITELDSTMKFVLEQGADPNPIYVDGNSALHYAALMRDTVSPIHLLADHGSDINRKNHAGCTPLTFACRANNVFTALALLLRGADPSIPNIDGLTAFDVVPDLDEWINSGIFDNSTIRLLEKHILKQGRLLVHTVANRIDQHQHHLTPQTSATSRRTTKTKSKHLHDSDREIIPANHYMTLS